MLHNVSFAMVSFVLDNLCGARAEYILFILMYYILSTIHLYYKALLIGVIRFHIGE